MAYTVGYAFAGFLDRIAIKGPLMDTANTRRDRIVELLGSTFDILHAFPTGSLVRGTALKRHADVDVMVVLHYSKHIANQTPKQVLEDVRAQLSSYNARLVRKNGQAVTLYFTTGPNVDIVPAKKVLNGESFSHYEIPDANRGTWIETNPHIHDAAMSRASLNRRQLIQMAKTWNHSHSEYLQSFHVEVLALLCDYVSDTDWPWTVFQFFDTALKSLDSYALWHPNGGHGSVDAYLSYSDRQEARARLERARDLARQAWYAVYPPSTDDAGAIGTYRTIFGGDFPAYG